MIRLILIALLISLSLASNAQELTLVKNYPLAKQVDQLAIDQFGTQYLVLNNELRKRNKQGKFEASFSDPIQGQIAGIDLLNPLNPIIYYRSSNLLRVLDNRLNSFQEFNLSMYFQDPAFIAASAEDNIWLYNQNTDRIEKFSLRESKVINRSPIFSQVLDDPESEVLHLSSSYDRVLVHLKSKGAEFILVFDAQGALQKKIPLNGTLISMAHFNRRLMVLYENQLLEAIDLNRFNRQTILCPQNSVKALFYFHPLVYLHGENQIWEYRLSLP